MNTINLKHIKDQNHGTKEFLLEVNGTSVSVKDYKITETGHRSGPVELVITLLANSKSSFYVGCEE